MPVVHFHLCEANTSEQKCQELLERASQEYARILEAPMERVRAFATVHKEVQFAAQGSVVANGGIPAPFFEAIILRGRPASQRTELIACINQLIADVLAIDPQIIRGRIIQVDPEDWCIAGKTAAEARKSEIEARARAAT